MSEQAARPVLRVGSVAVVGSANLDIVMTLEPPALDRLAEMRVPTLILLGGLDLDAIHDAARRVGEEIPDARSVGWADCAHLPSMEHPDDFLALLQDWLGDVRAEKH